MYYTISIYIYIYVNYIIYNDTLYIATVCLEHVHPRLQLKAVLLVLVLEAMAQHLDQFLQIRTDKPISGHYERGRKG